VSVNNKKAREVLPQERSHAEIMVIISALMLAMLLKEKPLSDRSKEYESGASFKKHNRI